MTKIFRASNSILGIFYPKINRDEEEQEVRPLPFVLKTGYLW